MAGPPPEGRALWGEAAPSLLPALRRVLARARRGRWRCACRPARAGRRAARLLLREGRARRRRGPAGSACGHLLLLGCAGETAERALGRCGRFTRDRGQAKLWSLPEARRLLAWAAGCQHIARAAAACDAPE
jgi:hypothetical protein